MIDHTKYTTREEWFEAINRLPLERLMTDTFCQELPCRSPDVHDLMVDLKRLKEAARAYLEQSTYETEYLGNDNCVLCPDGHGGATKPHHPDCPYWLARQNLEKILDSV